MIDIHDDLYRDFEAVRQISIVPTVLDVICRTTGMGFAAVARVTDNRWLACSVLDGVQFGLAAGEELKIETTICNEIKDNKKPVIIDNVAEDANYYNHHTPIMYGLQSYISFPIILKNGHFFGTLCAIDAKPANLNNPQVIGLFELFSDLLSFHLQSLDLMERSHSALQETNRQLNYSTDENLLYRQISNHNLQEPLRKIRLYTDLLENKTEQADIAGVQKLAGKVNQLAKELTNMIEHITDFSALANMDSKFELVDLNSTMQEVVAQLTPKLIQKNIVVDCEPLPGISAIPLQIAQLFFHLTNYITTFSKKDSLTPIHIYAKPLSGSDLTKPFPINKQLNFFEITIEKKGVWMDEQDIEHLFDIFVHSNDKQNSERYGAGLAYCRKIVHNHAGIITAKPFTNGGISFSIILPSNYKSN